MELIKRRGTLQKSESLCVFLMNFCIPTLAIVTPWFNNGIAFQSACFLILLSPNLVCGLLLCGIRQVIREIQWRTGSNDFLEEWGWNGRGQASLKVDNLGWLLQGKQALFKRWRSLNLLSKGYVSWHSPVKFCDVFGDCVWPGGKWQAWARTAELQRKRERGLPSAGAWVYLTWCILFPSILLQITAKFYFFNDWIVFPLQLLLDWCTWEVSAEWSMYLGSYHPQKRLMGVPDSWLFNLGHHNHLGSKSVKGEISALSLFRINPSFKEMIIVGQMFVLRLICLHTISEHLRLLIPASYYCRPWQAAVISAVTTVVPPTLEMGTKFLLPDIGPSQGPLVGICRTNQHLFLSASQLKKMVVGVWYHDKMPLWVLLFPDSC